MAYQVERGLDNIFAATGGGGGGYLTFEEGKPVTGIFLEWGQDAFGVREHYEGSLNPKYIRCPGKDVCPLCAATGKTPGMKVKFRILDAADGKVKMVSLAPTHAKKIQADFQIDGTDPTREWVVIYRTGKGTNDTNYSARKAPQQWQVPDFNTLDLPDLAAQTNIHSPEEIANIMAAVTNAVPQQPAFGAPPAPQYGGGFNNQPAPQYGGAPSAPAPQYGGAAPQYGSQPAYAPAPPMQQQTYAPAPQQAYEPVPQQPAPQVQGQFPQHGEAPQAGLAPQAPTQDPFGQGAGVAPQDNQYVPSPERNMPF